MFIVHTARTMNIYLFISVASFFTFETVSYAIDTINTSQILRDGETLISPDGTFELGFFRPGNSTNRYVGLWYKKVTVRTVVWVANRNVPLTTTSGLLRVMNPGILVLEDEANNTVWSTNASNSVPNPVARLLNSGNLVVKDANDDNPENFLWQSFNYPTDTLLPGMKLGWNFVTGVEIYLSSWRSNEDPSPGDFTYHCDPTGYPQNILRKNGVELYRTGPWNGIRFSGKPSLRTNSIFTYGLVINKNEVYYHFELIDSSVSSRLTLNPNGVAQRSTWIDRTQGWVIYLTSPTDNCDSYKLCGAYGTCNVANSPICGCLDKFVPRDLEGWNRVDWSSGCVRRKELDCEKGDGFLKYSGIKLPDTRHSWYNENMTLNECKLLCARNCSCMAYASLNISRGGRGTGCLLWYDELIDIRELSAEGQDIYIRMNSSDLAADGKKKGILVICLSLVTGLVLVGVSLMLYARRKKKIDIRQTKIRQLRRDSDVRGNKDLDLPLFDLHTISKATDNFSVNNKLGEGGYGPVYKGILKEGKEVAVKRLSRTSFQGVDEFMNEVDCISKLQHRNLVKLLGCCVQDGENILVYEHMINKSLDLVLFDPEKSALLDWPKRFHLINGIARGLMYLHQDSHLRIIHRDLKASNILLDSDMNPKISDFGLARICAGNETGSNTTHVVGTYGYMSPEYASHGLFSVKSDVFSFGVLLFEIVTSKRNRESISNGDYYLNLLAYMWVLYTEGRLLELVDSYHGSSHSVSEITRSIHIGLLCVQHRPEDRPTMSSVVAMLGSEGLLPEAKQPGFFMGRDIKNIESSVNSSVLSSVNEMSITQSELRVR